MSGPRPAGAVDLYAESEWQRKNGTLSDKTACKEFGLTYGQIVKAIRAGRLQYRSGSIYGNPFLRLLRSEVEAFVGKAHGVGYLEERKAGTELAKIDRELRQLKARIVAIERHRGTLVAQPGAAGSGKARRRGRAD